MVAEPRPGDLEPERHAVGMRPAGGDRDRRDDPSCSVPASIHVEREPGVVHGRGPPSARTRRRHHGEQIRRRRRRAARRAPGRSRTGDDAPRGTLDRDLEPVLEERAASPGAARPCASVRSPGRDGARARPPRREPVVVEVASPKSRDGMDALERDGRARPQPLERPIEGRRFGRERPQWPTARREQAARTAGRSGSGPGSAVGRRPRPVITSSSRRTSATVVASGPSVEKSIQSGPGRGRSCRSWASGRPGRTRPRGSAPTPRRRPRSRSGPTRRRAPRPIRRWTPPASVAAPRVAVVPNTRFDV